MGARHSRAVGGAVVAALTVGLAVGVQMNASAAVSPTASLVINEVYGGGGNSGAAYTHDFVELYNKGTSAVDLSGYSVQYASAAGTSWSGVISLGGSIAAQSSYLVRAASGGSSGGALPTADAMGNVNFSATTGNVALVSKTTALSCTTTACESDASVVDLVGYGGGAAFAGTGPSPAPSNTTSVNRASFANTADNRADFTTDAPSPTTGSTSPPPPTTTTPPASAVTPISAIQGTGAASPLVGRTVTTTGVVTAAYPTGGFQGFTLQTGGTGGDRSAATGSDAVFVYLGADATANPVLATVGQSLSVTGTVTEFAELTELAATNAQISTLDTALPAVRPATTATWPTNQSDREKLESMLYAPSGPYTVTNTFNANNFGEIGLAFGTTPLIQPTEVARPGTAEAAAVVADNAARLVALDDGSSANFLSSANNKSLTPPYVSLTNPVRVGAPVTFNTPMIVDYRNAAWKLEPRSQVTDTTPPDSRTTFANTRTAAPDAVGAEVSVSSFNVLNYFTTLGSQLTGCTSYNDRNGTPVTVRSCPDNGPRGAWNPADLQRQQDKIVAAINRDDASVIGLMEVENSYVLGEARDEALATLTDAANVAAGFDKWAYVPSAMADLPPASEMDVITSAIVYQPAKVLRQGDAHALGTQSSAGGAFDNAREPIAQAFVPVRGGTPFLVVVNHFKSKGSAGPLPGDTDQGDGQAASNASRVAQAKALAAWVPTVLPAEVTDAFLLGDFNSYAQEDPMQQLYAAGYSDITRPGDGYSYSFSGLSGSLDHVLANGSAKARITGTDVWNINSPESIALQYSRYGSSPTNFYAPDPYAASDHDPVKVGFTSGRVASFDLNLLNINDVHGRIDDNTVKLAGTVEQLRATGGEANTLLLSAGDNVGASLYASSSAVDADGNPTPDQPTIDVLNALGLQASALGNHELDRGQADLDGRVIGADPAQPNADWTYLGANVYAKGTTTPAYPGYTIKVVNGVKVAIIGALTQETSSLVSPTGIAKLTFGDPVEAVNRVAAELTDGNTANGEADVLVAEFHDGASEGTADGATLDKELAAGGEFAKIVQDTSPAVSAIFTGHTHKEYVFNAPVPGDTAGRTRPVLQTGAYGERIGQIVLTVDPATGSVTTKSAQNIRRVTTADATLVAQYPRVKTVQDITAAAIAAAAKTGGAPVGTVSADLTRAFSGGAYTGPGGTYVGTAEDRSEESTVGMLVANAVRDASIPSGEKPQIGITNPGGLRADLRFAGSTGSDADRNTDGIITVAEAVAVQPFANSLFLTTLTGAQLTTVLEQQDQPAGAARPYLALGLSDNVSFTYDRSRPVGSRITSITVGGQAIVATDTFRVATSSFLAAGGDNFTELAKGANPTDTGLVDLDVFVDHLRATSPTSPSFAKRGASLTGLSDAEKSPTAGSTIDFDLSDLGLTSTGSPQVTSVTAEIGSTALGTFPVTASTGTPGAGSTQTGTAPVSVRVPDSLSGPQRLTLTAAPGGTTIVISLAVTAAAPVVTGGDLAITMGAPTRDDRAGAYVLAVTVRNSGPGTVANVRTSLTSAGTVVLAGAPGGTVSHGTATFVTPSLAAGASVTYSVLLSRSGLFGVGLVVGLVTPLRDDPTPLDNTGARLVLLR